MDQDDKDHDEDQTSNKEIGKAEDVGILPYKTFNDAEVNDAGIANELVLDLPNTINTIINIAEHQSTDYVYQVEDQDY